MDPVLRPGRPRKGLSACPAGDVLCARAFADALLDSHAPLSPYRRDARLILTAAGLHLQADVRSAADLSAFIALLSRISAGLPHVAHWASSPMQFLQYAGAELPAMEPKAIQCALDVCVRESQSL